MKEQTLVLLKPDAVARQIMGSIISRFETVGLKIIGMKLVNPTKEFAKKHYREDDIAKRRGYDIWEQNLDFLTKGPVLAICLEGFSAIATVRKMVGSTQPSESLPGTIRGDYTHVTYAAANSKKKAIANIIHASSSVEDAKIEVALWFAPSELMKYKTVHDTFMEHEF